MEALAAMRVIAIPALYGGNASTAQMMHIQCGYHSSGCANNADCKNRPATCTALPKKHSDKAGPLGVRVPGRNTMGTALLGNTSRDGILGHQNPRTTGTGVHGEQKARAKSARVNRASACHQAAEPIPDHGDIGGATDPYY